MAILNPEQTSKAQWSWLVSTFRAEMASGKRLTLVNDVRRSLSLWTEYAPVVGVQLMDAIETQRSTKAHILTCKFVIQISAQSTAATASANGYSIPNLDDAMAQVDTILSDGAGNGVASILRDPANRTLGGNAGNSRIIGPHYQADVQPGSDLNSNPEIWAHVFVDFETIQQVSINS